MIKRLGGALVAMLTISAGLVVAGGPAMASTPTVSFSFAHRRVTQNTTLHLTVSSAHLPRNTTLYLQRDFGTNHVFKNVEKVPHNAGTTAPGVAMGAYKYRIVAIHGGSRIATSTVKRLWSYGPVTAGQLCNRSTDTDFEDSCSSGTVQVGSKVYSYHAYDYEGNTGPGGSASVIATRSSCRSAHITYAVSNDSASGNGTTSMGTSITQTSADMQQSSTAVGNVGSTTFKISSRAWDLEFWTDTGSSYVYWNGTFSCFSPSGDA